MGTKVKNQHYVPRMYLKRFSPNRKKICVWNFEKNVIVPQQRPENYAAKRFFYDANIEEMNKVFEELERIGVCIVDRSKLEGAQFVEHALSKCETDTSIIIDQLCDNEELIHNDDIKARLVVFLHQLAYRSLGYREDLERVRSQLDVSLSQFGLSLNDTTGVEAPKEQQLYKMMGITPLIETSLQLFANYKWYIGIAGGLSKLIISDDPVKGIMLGFNDICFPLTGDMAIVFRISKKGAPIISEDMPEGSRIYLSEKSIFVYNLMQILYAKRYLFGDQDTLKRLKTIIDAQGGLEVIRNDLMT